MSHAILHISDLHRSVSEPVDNDELISTLVADCDRYVAEEPAVPTPEAVVVSGDLVQGAPPGCADPDREVQEQYAVALDLLARLAERFAGGDRRKVILVPGNHDVAWSVARAAMIPVDSASVPADVAPAAFGPLSELRWDWKERRLHRIADRRLYEERFCHYKSAVDAFYAGTDLPFACEDGAYYRLFELFDGRAGVAAFNSCYGNDCFSFHGHIPQTAVARAHLDLHDRASGYDLLMAVWHHSIEGAPYASDYMDVEIIHSLIGKGFTLGLHGHQHRAQAAMRYIHLPGQTPMAIVSAGSLCAGRRDLPTGVNRQYNVIELDDDLTTATVHVREMAYGTVFAPTRRADLGGRSYVQLDLGGSVERAVTTRRTREAAAVADAERRIQAGHYQEATAVLMALRPAPGTYPRALLVRAFREGGQWEESAAFLSEPADADELALLVRAAGETGRHDDGLALLANPERVGMDAGTAMELRRWLNAQHEMRR